MENRIGCLILNYNSFADTDRCTENLLGMDKLDVLRIIIVDNASRDDSGEKLIKKYRSNSKVNIISSEENGGYAAGNNQGFRYIHKFFPEMEYVLLMNPDTMVKDVSVINDMRSALEADKKLAVIAPVVILQGVLNFKATAWNAPTVGELVRHHCKLTTYQTKQYIDRDSKGIVRVDAVQGAFFMIKMQALVEIGYLDEGTFMYCEEVLLARDLASCGYEEAVLCDSFFEHNHIDVYRKPSLKRRIYQEKNFYKSRLVYCKKHGNKVGCKLLKAAHIVNYIYIFVTHPVVKVISGK